MARERVSVMCACGRRKTTHPSQTCGRCRRNHAGSARRLTLTDLRMANLDRCLTALHPLMKWTALEYAVIAAGSLNRAAMALVRNYEDGADDPKPLRDAIADAMLDLDLLAARCAMSLTDVVIERFNQVSNDISCPVKLDGYKELRDDETLEAKSDP